MAKETTAAQIYKQVNLLDPEDVYLMAEKTKSEDKQQFYMMLGDFLLQKKQRKLIKENVF